MLCVVYSVKFTDLLSKNYITLIDLSSNYEISLLRLSSLVCFGGSHWQKLPLDGAMDLLSAI